MNEILNIPSPLHKIENELTQQFKINLFIKRDDLIHPEISGNKWRKLKYNILFAQQENKNTILTFGGAYSNHITATAKACAIFNLKCIGIIRGEKYETLNKSLQFAQDCGMQFLYLDRENYRNKNLDSLFLHLDSYYIVPEGGANELALKGCAEIVDEIRNIHKQNFDFICCACGTGTTLAGIASNLESHQKAIGFAVLKHDKLQQEITEKFCVDDSKFEIKNYHFNGYAKTTPELIQFIKDFYYEQNILLDYVYTGKMMYGIFDMIKNKKFVEGSTIIVVHTGGVMNANVFNL